MAEKIKKDKKQTQRSFTNKIEMTWQPMWTNINRKKLKMASIFPIGRLNGF